MKRLSLLVLWLKNIFNVKDPFFLKLSYVDYIIEGKGYLVLTWEIKNAYRIKIKSIGYKSNSKFGSAYIRVPSNADELSIVIHGSWKSNSFIIRLKKVVMDCTIQYPALVHIPNSKVCMPIVKLGFLGLNVESFHPIINTPSKVKVINISHPNYLSYE